MDTNERYRRAVFESRQDPSYERLRFVGAIGLSVVITPVMITGIAAHSVYEHAREKVEPVLQTAREIMNTDTLKLYRGR